MSFLEWEKLSITKYFHMLMPLSAIFMLAGDLCCSSYFHSVSVFSKYAKVSYSFIVEWIIVVKVKNIKAGSYSLHCKRDSCLQYHSFFCNINLPLSHAPPPPPLYSLSYSSLPVANQKEGPPIMAYTCSLLIMLK